MYANSNIPYEMRTSTYYSALRIATIVLCTSSNSRSTSSYQSQTFGLISGFMLNDIVIMIGYRFILTPYYTIGYLIRLICGVYSH